MYKRVVLKLSGEALAGNTDKNFDNETIYGIIDQIKEVISQGTQVTLVVGGGNFWREVLILLWIELKLTRLACLQLL